MSISYRGKIDRNRPLGSFYVAPALTNEKAFQVHEIKALIDTGATLSVISHEFSSKLQLVAKGKRTFYLASGALTLPEVAIRIGFQDKRQSAPVFLDDDFFVARLNPNNDPNRSLDFHMLLGMDVLRHCQLHVNGPEEHFTLSING